MGRKATGETRPTGIRIPEALKERAVAEARSRGVSLSRLVCLALEREVADPAQQAEGLEQQVGRALLSGLAAEGLEIKPR